MAKQFTVITGASSGIGKALATQYASPDQHLILAARNTMELAVTAENCENHGADTTILPLDLTSRESIDWFTENVYEVTDKLDRLIHVSGLSQRSIAEETSLSVDRRLMEVNYFGPIALTKALLPFLKHHGAAKLAVTSSISGKFGFYQRSAYSASKFALHGFFETFRMEHDKDNISVTILCPGSVNTNISKHALDAQGTASDQNDSRLAKGISPEKCARKMKKAIENQKKETYIGGKEIMMVYFHKYLPSIFYKIAKQNKPQ